MPLTLLLAALSWAGCGDETDGGAVADVSSRPAPEVQTPEAHEPLPTWTGLDPERLIMTNGWGCVARERSIRCAQSGGESAFETTPPSPPRALVTWSDRPCAILDDGRFACLEAPSPDGRSAAVARIVPTPALDDWTAVAATRVEVCGLSGTSDVRCFRAERWGPEDPPPQVSTRRLSFADATELVAGRAHFCARSEAGVVECWGEDARGQLGDGAADRSGRSVRVSSLGDAIAIAAYGDSSCALRSNGSVVCWGEAAWTRWASESHAPEGVEAAAPSRPLPERVEGLDEIVAVAGSCALGPEGAVSCWGRQVDCEGNRGSSCVTSFSPPAPVTAQPEGATRLANRGGPCVGVAGAWRCWTTSDGRSPHVYGRMLVTLEGERDFAGEAPRHPAGSDPLAGLEGL